MKKIILLLGLLMLTQLSFAQVPDAMSFQGYLTDNTTGIPIDGSFNIQFDIYDQVVAGSVLWTEMHVGVPVNKGIYNVILGSQGSPVLIPFDGSYWLEVTIDGSTLAPRVPLTTSAYSFSTRSVLGASNVFPGVGNVGIGNVNPTVTLDVFGTIKSDSILANTVIFPPGAFAGAMLSSIGLTGEAQWIAAPFSPWAPNGPNIFFNTGKVGIGTNAPAMGLEIFEDVNTQTGIRLNNPNTGAGAANRITFTDEEGDLMGLIAFNVTNEFRIFNNRANADINLQNGSGAQVYLNDNGNVGIKNINPLATLDVTGNIQASTNIDATGAINATGNLSTGANVLVTGEVQNTGLGNANVTAVAYGNVDATGAIVAAGSTNNFTVVPNGVGRYDITWTNGLNTSFLNSAVSVTASNGGQPRMVSWTSTGGGTIMIVWIFDQTGTPVDDQFNFIVFKP